jgi:hypothetical protein
VAISGIPPRLLLTQTSTLRPRNDDFILFARGRAITQCR